MNRQGPGPQMRLGGFSQASSASASRPVGGMPNGKLGGSGWQGGPPGVPNPPGSRPGSGLTFSQSVLSSQPGTPLDMNDFPALGGQPQNPNVQPWNRLNTQSPSAQNRPPQPEDIFANMDGYRMSGVGGVGGVGTQAQARQAMQPNSLDDFPALPRTQGNGDGIEDRGFMSLAGLGGTAQFGVRQGSLSAGRSGLVMGGGSQSSRLLDTVIQQTGNVQISDLEKKNLMKTNLSSMAQHSSPAPGMQNPVGHSLGAQQQQVQQSKLSSGLSGVDFGGNQPNSMQTSGMGETDRFGLGGLLSLIRGESGDYSMLALGQDLTQLGLDLNQPEAPLYPSFASPWADVDSKPVEPEYQLPPCYTVQNVQSLGTKVSSFSDETLFYIFYTMPRDIMQEVVAAELSSRNWRYHTALKLWLTKDNASDIRQISENAEKGIYVFFDPNAWERVRKEYVLDYTFLDHRAAPGIMSG
ncbi:hypothetical protein B9Z19DRAFT_1103863 [Tuber borchii]|uniref:NOT2/NOT3/NOT5 C-terminal domain-containing protein n=1 Tax=Tuber borchii TaxID=42251 RepID=A0A2T6ZDL6_TUBBO|nr:hypothetical protein B9Z19DRAFT_1103863 [Tuber borchii]